MKTRNIAGVLAVITASSGALAGIEGTMAAGVAPGQELCVVENPRVEAKFRDLMLSVLAARGWRTRMVEAPSDCPVSMTFSATYARTHYGAYAVLKTSRFMVYRDSQRDGEVIFRYSHGPFGNGTVEEVITRMVDKLLPASTGARPSS